MVTAPIVVIQLLAECGNDVTNAGLGSFDRSPDTANEKGFPAMESLFLCARIQSRGRAGLTLVAVWLSSELFFENGLQLIDL